MCLYYLSALPRGCISWWPETEVGLTYPGAPNLPIIVRLASVLLLLLLSNWRYLFLIFSETQLLCMYHGFMFWCYLCSLRLFFCFGDITWDSNTFQYATFTSLRSTGMNVCLVAGGMCWAFTSSNHRLMGLRAYLYLKLLQATYAQVKSKSVSQDQSLFVGLKNVLSWGLTTPSNFSRSIVPWMLCLRSRSDQLISNWSWYFGILNWIHETVTRGTPDSYTLVLWD